MATGTAYYKANVDALIAAIPTGLTTLYTNFVDVSLGTGDGTSTQQTIPAGAFTTVNLTTETADPGNRFASNVYVVPTTGLYDITARIRGVDGQAAGRGIGIGVHTSNADGPFFNWYTVSNPVNRQTYIYARTGVFASGASLRLFMYSDSGTFPVNAANLTITYLGPSA